MDAMPPVVPIHQVMNISSAIINGVNFTNKDLIQLAVYMSPTIRKYINGYNKECNSLIFSIDVRVKHLTCTFMNFPKHRLLAEQDLIDNGFPESIRDIVGDRGCCINTGYFEDDIYNILLGRGYLIDNFDLDAAKRDEEFSVQVQQVSEDGISEEGYDIILIPFNVIAEKFNRDPELV